MMTEVLTMVISVAVTSMLMIMATYQYAGNCDDDYEQTAHAYYEGLGDNTLLFVDSVLIIIFQCI
jgi:predicted acyltransferase